MSLDVYLTVNKPQPCERGSGIFMRVGGSTVEVSREEYDRQFPGREPMVLFDDEEEESGEVFRANITHNLCVMAREAGIYEALWRPDEVGLTNARQLIKPLRAGLERLRADPVRFEAMNPENGWGAYDSFVPWVARYLRACEKYPYAAVRVSR